MIAANPSTFSPVFQEFNESDNAPKVSNYLLTKKHYRDFRLVFEGKLAESSMHSGIAFWGKKFELQHHSNKVPQEIRFRGLMLSENPDDRLITLDK